MIRRGGDSRIATNRIGSGNPVSSGLESFIAEVAEDSRRVRREKRSGNWRVPHRLAALICALPMSVALAGCSSQPNPTQTPDAVALLQSVPPAEPAKYTDSRDKKSWRNPYLVVRSDGVGLLTGVTANEEQILKPDELLDALSRLPLSAWPYGRVAAVLVQETPTRSAQSSGQSSSEGSEQEKVALRRNRGTVTGELQRAHVGIVWIQPSKH